MLLNTKGNWSTTVHKKIIVMKDPDWLQTVSSKCSIRSFGDSVASDMSSICFQQLTRSLIPASISP